MKYDEFCYKDHDSIKWIKQEKNIIHYKKYSQIKNKNIFLLC